MNAVLTEHLLNKLFVPLYIFSLTPSPSISMAEVTRNLAAILNKVVDIDIVETNNPRISCVVALFLMSLIFLVIVHKPLVDALAWIILNGDNSVFNEGAMEVLHTNIEYTETVPFGFGEPKETLEEALESTVLTMSSSTSGISIQQNDSEVLNSTSEMEGASSICYNYIILIEQLLKTFII